MINLFQPSIGSEELHEISQTFDSKWIGKGKKVKQFEELFAKNLNVSPEKFLSTSSCTEAIFLAPKLFGIGPGDEVIVPTVSFIAVGNTVKESGADIVFCDVDPATLNICPDSLEEKLTKRTKAVFITHYGGYSCDMDRIMSICSSNNILLFEDSACAPCSFYKGKACGTFGDMGMWSFDAMKIITTGDGGMIYLKKNELVRKAYSELYLGLTKNLNSGLASSASKQQWWEIESECFGRRSIMNDISASIGIQQIKKMQDYISRRKEITDRYNLELANIEELSITPELQDNTQSSYYLYWIQTKYRDQLAKYLLDQGIYTSFRYWPLNKIKIFSDTGNYPHTEHVANTTLNLPVHQALSDDEVSHIINTIKSFLTKRVTGRSKCNSVSVN